MEKINSWEVGLTLTSGVIAALFGWFGWLVLILGGAMALDYATGTARAVHGHEWSSEIARQGLWHKTGILVSVIVAIGLDFLVGLVLTNLPIELPFEYSVLVAPIVVTWYVLSEMGSILENVGALGAPLPAFLKNIILKLHGDIDNAGDNITHDDSK